MRWNRRKEEELQRDINEHIAMETEEFVGRGMSPEEARYVALRKFGNVALVKEDTRREWGWAALDTWYADLRHAFRRIGRSPGTAALAVLSLALAFAPSVTVFSIMDRLFLTPIPIAAPSEIYDIGFEDTRPSAPYRWQSVSYPEYRDLSQTLRSFSGLAFISGHGASVQFQGHQSLVWICIASDNYFQVLGAAIPMGPGLLNDRPSVVISNDFWKRELGGRPDAVGQTVLVDGSAFTVTGVAGPGFRGANYVFTPDLWVTVERWVEAVPQFRGEYSARGMRGGTVWGRLKAGVPPERALAEVKSAAAALAREWPDTNRYLQGHAYQPLAERQAKGVTLTSLAVALLSILLAVACANVAGILLARAEERRHETAIRQALGASRARLAREWMVESAVLSGLGAALGLAGTKVLVNLLPGLLPAMIIPIHLEFGFGPRVWLYALSLMAVSALAFGAIPAWRGSRPGLLEGLRRDSAVSILRVRVPVRSLLIVAQVAAAELLLFGAGMTLDTVSAVRRHDPGMDPDRPVALAMVLPTNKEGGFRSFDCEEVRARLAQIPGVRAVSYGHSVPLSGSGGRTFKLEMPGAEPRQIQGAIAGPGFLSMLGARVLSGRDLQTIDRHGALVGETLARQLDPAGKVLGRDIRLDGSVFQIVGVIQNVKFNAIYDPARPLAVVLAPPRGGGDIAFAIAVDRNPAAYVGTLRSELIAALPGATVSSSKTLRRHYRDSLFLEYTATEVFYTLGGLALVLAAAGLHGIARALFARRSKEFAIRLALGAAPRRVARDVLASAFKLAACGLALGLAIAIPAGLYVAAKTEGMSGFSALTVGGSSMIVIVAALAAAAQPAARVLRIQPGVIVRAE